MKYIKEISALVTALCLFNTAAFAAVITPSETDINTGETGEITFTVTLTTDAPFAGAEFGLKPSSEDVVFKNVEYSKELRGEAIVKTVKDGTLYFGFFAANNKYASGSHEVAEVTYTYSGDEERTIELVSSKIVMLDEETNKTYSDTGSEPFTVTINRNEDVTVPTVEPSVSPMPANGTSGGSSSSGGRSSGSSASSNPTPTPVPQSTPKPDDAISESTEPYTSFTDIENHWAREAICEAVKAGYFSGVSDTEFMPDGKMTRAMAAAVIGRFANAEETQMEIPFEDVPDNAYYRPYLSWCAGNSIIMGMDETTFAPDLIMTREQFSAILCRYMDYIGVQTDISGKEIMSYNDSAAVSDWAVSGMNNCVSTGLLAGDDNNCLRPKDGLTRAEFAAIIVRLAKKYNNIFTNLDIK